MVGERGFEPPTPGPEPTLKAIAPSWVLRVRELLRLLAELLQLGRDGRLVITAIVLVLEQWLVIRVVVMLGSPWAVTG